MISHSPVIESPPANLNTKKTAFSSNMSGGAILKDFSRMAISRDLGRVRRRAYTGCEAEIRGFLIVWALLLNYL